MLTRFVAASAVVQGFAVQKTDVSSKIMALNANGGVTAASTAEGGVSTCADYCDSHQNGVDETTEQVCMGENNVCVPASSCAQAAASGGVVCAQKFHPTCGGRCSEWENADAETINVCKSSGSTDSYKCKGVDSGETCDSTSFDSGGAKCKQQPIPMCSAPCEGFLEVDNPSGSGKISVTVDSAIVCQNRKDSDATDWNKCMPLPCDLNLHNNNAFDGAEVCMQDWSDCPTTCATGSTHTTATDQVPDVSGTGTVSVNKAVCYYTKNWDNSDVVDKTCKDVQADGTCEAAPDGASFTRCRWRATNPVVQQPSGDGLLQKSSKVKRSPLMRKPA